jgi:hypothetical protein
MTATPRRRPARMLRWIDDPLGLAPGYPPILHARGRWAKAAGVALGVTLITMSVWDSAGLAPGPRWREGAVVVAGVSVLVIVLSFMGTARIVGRARRADGNLCVRCAYDLRDLEGSGICPECGGAYDRAATRRAWALAARANLLGRAARP